MRPTEELSLKAAALQRNAPQEWRAFVAAFSAYNDVHRDNLVMSPLPELPVNQGRAQALSSLLELFEKSAENADKIRKQQK